MGETFASCGHRLDDGGEGSEITVVERDKEEKPGWCSMVVCDACRRWYEDNNLVVRDAEGQMRRGEMPHV